MEEDKAKRVKRNADTKKAKKHQRIIKQIKQNKRKVSYSKIGINIENENSQ